MRFSWILLDLTGIQRFDLAAGLTKRVLRQKHETFIWLAGLRTSESSLQQEERMQAMRDRINEVRGLDERTKTLEA